MSTPDARALRPLVGDLRQVASVRRIVLDDGAERGVRALAFSTGGGLDFWAMADRSLDIGTLSLCGAQLGWQSPAGFRSPALGGPDDDGGFGFNRSFSGFLVTCGLDHIRQPRDGHPLHGRLPHTPARLIACGEDWNAPEPLLFCEGEIVQWRCGGEGYSLRRRIEAPIGGRTVRIRDRIENIGTAPGPLHLLYHFNLGYPLVASGAAVDLNGTPVVGPLAAVPDAGSRPAVDIFSCEGEATQCHVRRADGGHQVRFRWNGAALPFLQVWRDLRPRSCVLSIEPCTAGRDADGANTGAPTLAPGDVARFEVDIEVATADGT